MTKILKTTAKAMGLKSTLVFDDKVVLSSFAEREIEEKDGKKKKIANIEKVTDFDGNEDSALGQRKLFDASVTSKRVKLTDKSEVVYFDNPARSDVGQDYIGVKGQLEKTYFGKEYPHDNAHIQIAYNAMDIKKILAMYINNIVYMFYNFNRDNEDAVKSDIIGFKVRFEKKYNQLDEKNKKEINTFLKNLSGYFPYFDGIFSNYPETGNINKLPQDKAFKKLQQKFQVEQKNYDVLRVVSMIRQACVHSTVSIGNRVEVPSDTCLYNIDGRGLKELGIADILSDTYSSGARALDGEFVSNSKNNLYVLRKIYPSRKREDLLRDYYGYVVLKEQNNIGINLTKLREGIVDAYYPSLKDKRYDTFRGKVYTVLNFVLLDWLKSEKTTLAKMVEELRRNMTEEGKDNLYGKYASIVNQGASSVVQRAIAEINSQKDRSFKDQEEISKDDLKGFGFGSNISCFAKILYFMTKFLDGKEINELLCAMINKFDNIADLIDTVSVSGGEVKFVEPYGIFAKAREVANQIRIVKNIARMKVDPKNYTVDMALDALNMLGIKTQIVKYDNDGNETRDFKKFKQDFYEELDYDKYGNVRLDKKGNERKNHKLRNFIINNILKSRRFFYIAKYTNPRDCAKMMQNDVLLNLALKDLPETQLNRYYKAVSGRETKADYNTTKKMLIDRVKEFSADAMYKEIKSMSFKDYKADEEGTVKDKYKSILGLYLTIAYIIVKSIVKVNARFVIAFSCLDRDYQLVFGYDMPEDKDRIESLRITEEFLQSDARLYKQYGDRASEIRADVTLTVEEQKNACAKAYSQTIAKAHFNKHSYTYVLKNFERYMKGDEGKPALWGRGNTSYFSVVRNFRNAVAHLNIIPRFVTLCQGMDKAHSFYAVYCYSLQKHLCNLDTQFNNGWLTEYSDVLAKHRGYSKDLTWLICLPFAYNLSRYKNLCIEDLFNRQEEKK